MSGGVRVAYVLRSWPRLSQTFIVNEIIELERAGVTIALFPLARSDEPLVQPQIAEVSARIRYLDAGGGARARMHLALALDAPRRYFSTLAFALVHRELRGGYTKSSALQAFEAAVQMAWHVHPRRSSAYDHIHAHFAHDPAFVGLLAHRLTGIRFSFTAHARDLYQIPPAALVARAREATAVVTCCESNARHIGDVIKRTAPVELVYHGVDLHRFHPVDAPPRNGVPHIVSVGRLIEKKGYDDLLHAFAILKRRGVGFTCDVFGDGPLRAELTALRDRLGLGGMVNFSGARTQTELLSAYQRADVFALTPCVTEDGDRDGVPNVLLEAMACALPVVTTRVGGIAEVVQDNANGLLTEAKQPVEIARQLGLLLADARLRERLGAEALRTAERFDGRNAAQQLAALFSHPALSAHP